MLVNFGKHLAILMEFLGAYVLTGRPNMIFRRSWTVSALSSVFRSGSSNLSEAGAY